MLCGKEHQCVYGSRHGSRPKIVPGELWFAVWEVSVICHDHVVGRWLWVLWSSYFVDGNGH